MRYITIILIVLFSLTVTVSFNACSPDYETEILPPPNPNPEPEPEPEGNQLKITIGTSTFTAVLQNNATVAEFKKLLPLTLNMRELNNNEKYADLPNSLPTNSSNPGTIQNGDLMLYGSSTLVLFYKTFSTSYNYTRLGHVDNPAGLQSALGYGNVTVTFKLQQQ